MTREEAIAILKNRDMHGVPCGYTSGYSEALDMAIEALKKQTVYEQVKWERDWALKTLEEHGIGLGQKAENATTTDCISWKAVCGVPIKEVIEVLEKYKHSPSVTPTEQQNKEKEHDGKSICHTCATNNCPFQSGIYRNNCDFYTSVNEGRR